MKYVNMVRAMYVWNAIAQVRKKSLTSFCMDFNLIVSTCTGKEHGWDILSPSLLLSCAFGLQHQGRMRHEISTAGVSVMHVTEDGSCHCICRWLHILHTAWTWTTRPPMQMHVLKRIYLSVTFNRFDHPSPPKKALIISRTDREEILSTMNTPHYLSIIRD